MVGITFELFQLIIVYFTSYYYLLCIYEFLLNFALVSTTFLIFYDDYLSKND